MDRDELLERSHPAEAEHGTFLSSERLMGTEGPRSEFSARLLSQ